MLQGPRQTLRLGALAPLLATIVALAACGGGGGGDGDVASTAPAQAVASGADARQVIATAAAAPAADVPFFDPLPGPGYAVDAVRGDDRNPGSAELPFRSLARLNRVRLKDGEGIYLHCGSTWRDTLFLGTVQLAPNAVVAGYGNCPDGRRARVSAADDYSGNWTRRDGIWSRPVPVGLPPIQRVTVDGVPHRLAQWPNAAPAADGPWARVSADSRPTRDDFTVSATDLPQLLGKGLAGATVQVRTEPWLIEQRRVGAFDEARGLITLDGRADYTVNKGEAYVLQNQPWMLDAPGEFFHDAANGVLYVIPATPALRRDLNQHVVEFTVRERAISLAGRRNLTLRGIDTDMALGDGIRIEDSPNVTIDDVTATGHGQAGIRVMFTFVPPAGTKSGVVQRSVVRDAGEYGIHGLWAPMLRIADNVVTGTGTDGRVAMSWAGIYSGPGAIVERNDVEHSAYAGIRFEATSGVRVSDNRVAWSCQRVTDCAAMYTWNGHLSEVATGSRVERNQVMRVGPPDLDLAGAVAGLVAGIYLDDDTVDVTLVDNVVAHVPVGLYLHNASRNTIERNRFWLTTSASIYAAMDRYDLDAMSGNVFRLNEMVPLALVANSWPVAPKVQSSVGLRYWHAIDGLASITGGSNSFVQNRVVQIHDRSFPAVQMLEETRDRYISARDWVKIVPAEAAPPLAPLYGLWRVQLGPELMSNGAFDAGLDGWTPRFYPDIALGTATALSSAQGCVGGCVRLDAATPFDTVESSAFALTRNDLYQLQFQATMLSEAGLGLPILRTVERPQRSMAGAIGPLTPSVTEASAGSVLRYKAFFQATAGGLGTLNIGLDRANAGVLFDSVSLRQVLGYKLSRPADWVTIASADRRADLVLDCPTLGWPAGCQAEGLDGVPVPLPTVLPAGGMRLLMRADSPWRRQ